VRVRIRTSFHFSEKSIINLVVKHTLNLAAIFKVCLSGYYKSRKDIHSSSLVRVAEIRAFKTISRDIPDSEAYSLSQDPVRQHIEGIKCLPWNEGLLEIGL
jgi:hypothetical protein